ncbi:MAG: NDP-sugar synthase, partial [Anaerolineales bacterium]
LLSDQMALPLYAFQKDFYQDLVSIELSERNEFEIPSAIQHLIDRGGVVMGTESSWRMTINTPEEYLAAVREMLLMDKKAHREPPHELNPGTNIRKPVHIEDSVFIGEGATIGPCAYLMEGSSIGDGARVRDSIVYQGAEVGNDEIVEHKIVLSNAIIDLQKSRGNRGLIHRP